MLWRESFSGLGPAPAAAAEGDPDSAKTALPATGEGWQRLLLAGGTVFWNPLLGEGLLAALLPRLLPASAFLLRPFKVAFAWAGASCAALCTGLGWAGRGLPPIHSSLLLCCAGQLSRRPKPPPFPQVPGKCAA